MLNLTINEERCIQCGKCVADCPAMCITMEKDKLPTIPDEDSCIRCQHCLAVCPTGALSILNVNPDESIALQYALPTAPSMETLIKGRRSTRNYKNKSLEPETLNKLIATSWHAPTGTNAQGVLFSATANKEATDSLRKGIYTKLDKLVPELDPEDPNLAYKYISMAHGAYTNHGIDVILRGAPHILIASAPKTIPLPKEDCIIALTTFDLLAQTMGVGTLWNGMLKWCLSDFFPELAKQLGVPDDHQIGYTMVFGRPAVQYHRTVQRPPTKINLVDSF